jgi:phenylpropionate dioxygenase-like ring-hydroxylating dioxygenase large terminal subunit
MMTHSKWVRDSWYVIAWDHEIPAIESTDIFTRTVLNEPIIVFRTSVGTSGGELVAMQDRCCHRHAPLSKGKREGDCIRCGYHGLKFDAQGKCVDAPGIAIIPEKAFVKTYPVVAKNRWVFVWMGDPSKADAALLPDNFSSDHPDWQYKPGYFHYATPYLLICDNLLDFSHLSYVHEKTLGGSTAIAQAVPTIAKTFDVHGKQNGIKVSREVPNVPAPPFYQKFRTFTEHVDRWFIYEFLVPGTLLMHSGGRPISDAKDDLSRAVQLHSCQTLTPETESTTHYFFQQSHRVNSGANARDSDALDEATAQAMTESIYNSLVGAFNEDRDMITAQHQSILRSPEVAMLPLAIDSALVQFRRLIDARINEQTS